MTQRSRDRNRPTILTGRDAVPFLPSRAAALEALGPVVYAVRVGGLVKIGFTSNLARRLVTLRSLDGGADVELLGFRPGARDDEAALHRQLADHRARGREYYLPHSEVLAVVNTMREALRLPSLAA